MDTYDVFICYQNKADKIVNYIVTALEEAGISCWYAPRNVGDGLDYDVIISKVISCSSCVIAVISDEALSSQWVKHEIVIADNHNIPIISFEIAPTKIQNGLTLRLAAKRKIVAYKAPSNSIDVLIKTIKGFIQNKNNESSDSDNGLSNEIGTKGTYSIRQNSKGEIMIMMEARQGGPENPRFIYDGKDVALLYRNSESSVAFRHIDEGARTPLMNVKEILVVELVGEDVEREYMVPVRIVKDVNNLIIK